MAYQKPTVGDWIWVVVAGHPGERELDYGNEKVQVDRVRVTRLGLPADDRLNSELGLRIPGERGGFDHFVWAMDSGGIEGAWRPTEVMGPAATGHDWAWDECDQGDPWCQVCDQMWGSSEDDCPGPPKPREEVPEPAVGLPWREDAEGCFVLGANNEIVMRIDDDGSEVRFYKEKHLEFILRAVNAYRGR